MRKFLVPTGLTLLLWAACDTVPTITEDTCAGDQVFVPDMCLECGPTDECLETGPACRPPCDDTAAFDCVDGARVLVCG
jgi:hypothetical protein